MKKLISYLFLAVAPKTSSIGKIGNLPKGSGIEEVPLRYRRRPIDEEEIAAINVRTF